MGELITLDLDTLCQGYYFGMTYTLPVNGEEANAESHLLLNVYQIVLQAQSAVIPATHPGARYQQVDDVVHQVIIEAGYGDYLGYNTGHAIGTEAYEGPRFSPWDITTLQPGVLLTMEPGIYLPRQRGVCIEDVVLVIPRDVEVLYIMPKVVLLMGEV